MRMNTLMWQIKHQVRRKPWLMLVLMAALLMPVLVVWMLSGTRADTEKRTVGQAVIDGWSYGGYDSSANLVFQQGQQVVLLPSGSKRITLNGKSVDVVASSPQALEIAKSAATTQSSRWTTAPLWLLVGVGIGLLLGRLKPPGPKSNRKAREWQRKWQPRRMMR